ncbi:MAG: DUF3179 domain-containing protein [Anaerolineales bacterium]
MQLAADIDDIPAIFASDELFLDARAGSREWPPDELVIGLAINGQARAYPIRLLSLHEIVNDVVGGQPVAVTWCPLCYTAIVFNRVVDGRELTFGVSGYLYRNNLVMYDHQTNTFWSQALTQAIRGAQRGRFLEMLPSVLAPWREWQAQYPHTTILSAEKMGQHADAIIDPYAGYYESNSIGMTSLQNPDDRLNPKSLVIGLQLGGHIRAYPLESVRKARLINDRLGETNLLLVYDQGFETVLAYNTDSLTFSLDTQSGFLLDDQTASRWDPKTATAIDGTLKGQTLSRLVSPLVYWFAWADIHPDTELYSP